MQCNQSQQSRSLGGLNRFWRAHVANIVARLLYRKPQCHAMCVELVRNKSGMEIGGPSEIFSSTGLLPLYPSVGALDNCNFTEDTLWGRNMPHHGMYRYASGKPAGRQHILEAVDLHGVPSASYDFLLSSHTIEHVANPIKALEEWKRIVKLGGILILVIPHRDGTFDQHRPVTSLDHLLQDYRQSTAEDDLTHLEEIMRLHDFSRDKGARSKRHFYERALDNLRKRGLHHHVFDTRLAAQLLDHSGLQIISIEPKKPFHIFAVARVPPLNQKKDNSKLMHTLLSSASRSPFPTDKYSVCPEEHQIHES